MASRAIECRETEGREGSRRCAGDGELAARAEWLETECLPHRPWLLNWVARRFPHEPDLDDIVQESFERVLGRRDVGAIDNVRGYLGRTAHSILLSRVRRRQLVEFQLCGDLDALGKRCPSPLPDEQVAARGDLDKAGAVLAALPKRTREIVLLRRLDEVSQRDTAARIGISTSAVEKHLRRGVRALREQLGYEG